MSVKILVVDDETSFLESVRRGLFQAGFKSVILENDPTRAVSHVNGGNVVDLALIDVTMPGMDGLSVLEAVRAASPDTECVMVSALNDTRTAVESIRRGAYDYLLKPISPDDLVHAVNRALERKRLLAILSMNRRAAYVTIENEAAFSRIVTNDPAMQRLLREAELHAQSGVPCLVTGESGTGKELLAQAMHAASPRADKPFTAINMAALSPTLFDSEFFGHTRGAFTGAETDRSGYLETTNHGTLFLDEIGILSGELQGKLLRVLQEGEYMKLGTSRVRRSDIRFIAATNADLDDLVDRGEFRKDLYYRLRGAWLHLPPLRERNGDIALLAGIFLSEYARAPGCQLTPDAMDALSAYEFPGNIRELGSVIRSACNLANGGPVTAGCLPSYILSRRNPGDGPSHGLHSPRAGIVPLADVERGHILAAYELTGRNKARTARMLGIGLNTLRRKLKAYSIL
ncbi:MAG: sigma-54-dependent transcriptional regulator [Desulfatibacillaceae bacterium]